MALKESIKNWLGKWENDDGYWLDISEQNGEVLLKRSGDIGSKLSLSEISEDSLSLIYVESSKDMNIRHTLTHNSKGVVSDNWYLLDEKTNWQTMELRLSSSSKVEERNVKLLDQGKANNALFDESKFDQRQSDFLSRLMREIRGTLLEELSNSTDANVKPTTEDISMMAENIGFAITSVIDGCDVIGDNTSPMPHLAFRENGRIVTNKSGSYLHEMVSGYFDDEEFNE